MRRGFVAAIMCASLASLCAPAPAGAQSTLWSKPRQVTQSALTGISCPGDHLCVATEGNGAIIRNAAPTLSSSDWQQTDAPAGAAALGIACPSVVLCVALTPTGVEWTNDPLGQAWTTTQLLSSGELTAISCPSMSLCVLSDSEGDVISSTDPTGPSTAWVRTQVDQASVPGCSQGVYSGSTSPCQALITSLACPTSRLCVGVDDAGNALVTADPAETVSWAQHPISALGAGGDLLSVACPTTTLCLTLNASTLDVAETAQPLSGTAWTSSLQTPARAIFCGGPMFCVVSGADSSDPATTSTTEPSSTDGWTSVGVTDRSAVTGLACPDPGLCLLTDAAGRTVIAEPGTEVARLKSNLVTLVRELLSQRGAASRGAQVSGQLSTVIPGTLRLIWTAGGRSVLGTIRQIAGAGTATITFRLSRGSQGVLKASTAQRQRITASFKTPLSTFTSSSAG
jgi:hypothetical protein